MKNLNRVWIWIVLGVIVLFAIVAFVSCNNGTSTNAYVPPKTLAPGVMASDTAPTWSPDGKKIAFVSNRFGNRQIFVMNVDGTNTTNLSKSNTVEDDLPAWSPDGKKIAFVSGVERSGQIYVMNSDGSDRKNLSLSPAHGDTSPVWSPDGSQIAFVSNRNANYEVYIMSSDGSSHTNLTKSPKGDDYAPMWSPDGKKIYFISNRSSGDKLYVMDSDGSNPKIIIQESIASKFSISSSAFLVFDSERNGSSQLFLASINGGNSVALSLGNNTDFSPAFSPDDSKIAFVSNRDGNDEIYVMNADGSNPVRLTNN